jgi:pimeloyl-ACP methyl ester carboxylesterase
MTHYILIHGSWHGAWCWHKVADRLKANGHTVDVPDLPCHGKNWGKHKDVTTEDYVRTVTDLIDAADGPVTLVAHSRGGLVGSSVAEARPDKVQRTIYVAAFLVPNGKSVVDYGLQDEQSLILPNLDQNPDEGWDMLQSHIFREALYADCDDDDVALCHLLLTPEPVAPTFTPLVLSEERYGRVPRSYIMLTEDRAVSPSLQRMMLEETPCEIFELEASHSAYFSKPGALTRLIEQAGERQAAA